MADVFHLLFVCLYHTLHALYSVAVCVIALARLCTSHMQRRVLVHRCREGVSALAAAMMFSSSYPAAAAATLAFVPPPSSRLPSSSLPPFPMLGKIPHDVAVAFHPSALHPPLLPYLVLWSVQAGSSSLHLHDLEGSIAAMAEGVAEGVRQLMDREEGQAMRSREVIVRTKRRVRAGEEMQPALRRRLLAQVGKGLMPTQGRVFRVKAGRCTEQQVGYTTWNHAGDEEEAAAAEAGLVKEALPVETEEDTADANSDEGAECRKEGEKTEPTRRRMGNRPRAAASNGHGANGHGAAHANGATLNGQQHDGSSNGQHSAAPPPFIVTLLSAEDAWDDIVNSSIQLALPPPASPSSSAASVAPFPPPDSLAPPSDILRTHILSHSFPLFPMSEPQLLLVFSPLPLTVLSFPPWLQRRCEIDHLPASYAAVMDRQQYERVLQRYSRTVQRVGT